MTLNEPNRLQIFFPRIQQSSSLHRDAIPNFIQLCLADASDDQKVLHPSERRILFPVVQDPLGKGRADSREGLEFP
jgi:hypothetical protein